VVVGSTLCRSCAKLQEWDQEVIQLRDIQDDGSNILPVMRRKQRVQTYLAQAKDATLSKAERQHALDHATYLAQALSIIL
jgi:hypothetical protein